MPALSLFLLLVPLAYGLGALAMASGPPAGRWRLALGVAGFGPLAALGGALALAAGGRSVGRFSLDAPEALDLLSTRLDPLTVVTLLLVTGIAGVILRFSQRYLAGEPGQAAYVTWFLATMGCASLLVVTNHLLVLALAWTGSSLALHQLLTFYDERVPALLAAHKKFLLSRVADLAVYAALVLLWQGLGTLRLDLLFQAAARLETLPAAVHAAGVLLAVGVVLRSAQLPFHGWLVQVMEAPTPVSALLHAGIVNIGGFVLIRLADLGSRLDAAQAVLVLAGTTTAVLAGLVMTTRVSVKVGLAWSTSAQMGFMLLECGLGAYGLALVHLVAHSVYKAHAFLSSGRAVERQVLGTMAPGGRVGWVGWLAAAAAGALLVATVGLGLGLDPRTEPGLVALAAVLALSVAPLLVRAATGGLQQALRLGAATLGLVALAVVAHGVALTLVPPRGDLPAPWLTALVCAAFLLLFATQTALAVHPTGRLSRVLYPACFAGFYLDELFTRLTFTFWPPRAALARVVASEQRGLVPLERAS